MRVALCVLGMAVCTGIASAQEQVSNFEACVSEAKQKHSDAVMANYLSYKCDGATAQRLAARPDQCDADVKPSLRNVERRSRQLEDGLYQRIVWRTAACAGMCETRIYNDSRDTNYLCEVRRHTEDRATYYGPPPRNTYYGRDADENPPQRRVIYGPAIRTYDQSAPSVYRRRAPESERERLVEERWYYIMPGWHLEYEYDEPSSRRRDDDDDRRYDSRRDSRDDDRGDSYRIYEYRRSDSRRGDRGDD
jgi:hypothetical protein